MPRTDPDTTRSFKVHPLMWPAGSYLFCRTCGHDEFYDCGRSLDHYYYACANCGAGAQSLTETGASA